MKTAFGKLTMLAFVLAIGLMLLAPMRSGIEDSLTASLSEVTLEPGESASVTYELVAETAQTVVYRSDDPAIAMVNQRGQITAVSPGRTAVHLTAQGGASTAVIVEVSGVPVSSFSLNTHELEMNKGDVSGLSYQFNYGATAQNVVWSSADPEIVRVDNAGRVSAVGAGETYITATAAGGMSDTALIRVNVRGTAVQIAPEALTVGVGTAFRLEVHYLPEDATDSVVQWASSAPQVLSVDADGLTHAISAGTATVTVATRDGLTASAVINVEPASKDFLLTPTELTMERGDIQFLEASFIGADGQVDQSVDHHVQWESSDPSVATVEDGTVIGVKTGKATITATADGFEAECIVTVHTSVTEVHLNVSEQSLYKNQTDEPFQIRATVVPSDADDRTLTYSSDNELVATVNQNGLVTMTGGYGTAVITVEASSGAKAVCIVNVIVSGE